MVSHKRICKGYFLRIAAGVVMLVLLMAGNVGATSIAVCPSSNTSCPYHNIQLAINASTPGNTILVYSDVYHENVNVTKKLTLRGIDNGSGKPIVDAGGVGSAITLSAGMSTLDGFEATNGSDAGITVGSDNNIIKNNTVLNNVFNGIDLEYLSENNTLISNTVSNNGFSGIALEYSSDNNTLSDNTVSNNSASGIFLDYLSNDNILGNNTASNNSVGIILYSNNTLIGNTASDNSGIGIYLLFSNNTLSDNTVSNNIASGIFLDSQSDNNMLSNNIVSNNSDGIDIFSSNNTLSSNAVSNNGFYGIFLSSSSNNMLSGNNASNNGASGFVLDSNNDNLLGSNIASNNNMDGIDIYYSSNNTLNNNTASNNYYYGIVLESSNKNIFYNNYFNNINDSIIENSTENVWNTTKTLGANIINGSYIGGNVWANPDGTGFSQTCRDADGDGICDSAYALDANNTDYLPLALLAVSFDTGAGGYPSIMGTHKGNITLTQNLTVSKIYTYPSPGTGGHSEYVRIWNSSGWNIEANWSGYMSDWHNITFNQPFTLYANVTYNYTIRTGSYPQIIHNSSLSNSMGTINSTEFIDANGRRYAGWIPAIRLE